MCDTTTKILPQAMIITLNTKRTLRAFCFALLLSSVAQPTEAGVIFTRLVSFAYTNGANPESPLFLAQDGQFYGTTRSGRGDGGGSVACGAAGTVFRLSPSGMVGSIASFDCTNGVQPYGGLVQATDGNFYGTTAFGGAYGYGTVFQVTPAGTLSTLYSFDGTNGINPCGLIKGNSGRLYGTASFGGQGYNGSQFSGRGTVFAVETNGALITLVRFNGTNGYSPNSLIQDQAGTLYGTTTRGGPLFNSSSGFGAFGTVFNLGTNGDLTTIA